MSLTLRSTKGSPLTHAEMDANWAYVIQSSSQSFSQAGTGAITSTVQDKDRRRVDVLDFIPTALHAGIRAGTESTDLVTYLASAWAYVSVLTFPSRLVFQSGRYYASAFPNFAVQDAEVDAEGEVRLRYTGTGVAIDLDGGAAGAGVYNAKFGNAGMFIIEAANTATHAIRARAFHAGLVRAKVLGCGNTSAGLKTQWCVCTEFYVIVSVNHEGWYSALRPGFGYDLDLRGAGEFTSYCTFDTPIVEGPNIGIKLTATLGNNFFGGTSEGCGTYGVQAGTAAHLDKFYGSDFEANTTADVFCDGDGIVFRDCDSNSNTTFGTNSIECKLIGGNHKTVLLDSGSSACVARDLIYNRANDGGTFTDAGNNNRVSNLIDGGASYPISDGENYVSFEEDFFGDVLADQWHTVVGTDPQCVAAAITTAIPQTAIRMTTGDDVAADMATNGTQLDAGVMQWRLDSGGFEIEFRFKIDSITVVAWFIGMTDQFSALEMPFTISGTTLTSNTSNGFGILFDTDATTDNWKLVGVASDVDATTQDAGVAPTAATFERWRIIVTSAGVARFYRNGALIGSAMTGAVNGGIKLTPVIAGFSRTTASKSLDCDRIRLMVKRV